MTQNNTPLRWEQIVEQEVEKYHDPNGMTYAQYLGFTHGMERAFELMKPELEKAFEDGIDEGAFWGMLPIDFETWYNNTGNYFRGTIRSATNRFRNMVQ